MRCPRCTLPNPEGMRFCGKCGTPLKTRTLERERRNVSVVFIDLSGFSTLTSDWIPEQLRDLADETMTVVAGIIEDYDGYVDSFQGDGLIALFGAPHSHPDDPHRAVIAASAGLKAIEAIGKSKGYPLKGRAGVNTGIVIAGSIGSGRVREYTVMGSTVNLAARLESAASPGNVWVGPETYEATRHRIIYDSVSPVSLDGFPSITEVHKLVSVQETADVDPYAHIKFVGRKEERKLLFDSFSDVIQSKRAKTLWLMGEAGIGKTRLLKEFTKDLKAKASANVIWVEESLEMMSTWRHLASQAFNLPVDEDNRNWQQLITNQVKAILPQEPRWQNYILGSLGIIETKPWRRIERRSIDRVFIAWCDLLVALTEEQAFKGLVFVIEHGSQASSFNNLPHLLNDTHAPILVIRTSRKQDPPPEAKPIVLHPLPLEESLELVQQIANPLLKVATESLVFQVGGIPSNILELGSALSITPQTSFSGSLASLLQSRLDMLTQTSRRLLALAALTGERCWEGLILELAGADNLAPLHKLATENLLVKEPSSMIPEHSEYRFQSELLRRAVLRMIPFSERPKLHMGIASWLEKHAPLSLSALIGYHFKEGGSHEASYPHYLSAADLAVNEGETSKAFELFETLLNLEVPPKLLAQGALAYAQAAITYCEKSKALEQLNAADQWIEQASDEGHDAMRQVHARLCLDVQHC